MFLWRLQPERANKDSISIKRLIKDILVAERRRFEFPDTAARFDDVQQRSALFYAGSKAGLLPQLLDQFPHRREQIPGNGVDARRGPGLVQLHQGRVGVLVEAQDLGAGPEVVDVLGRA